MGKRAEIVRRVSKTRGVYYWERGRRHGSASDFLQMVVALCCEQPHRDTPERQFERELCAAPGMIAWGSEDALACLPAQRITDLSRLSGPTLVQSGCGQTGFKLTKH